MQMGMCITIATSRWRIHTIDLFIYPVFLCCLTRLLLLHLLHVFFLYFHVFVHAFFITLLDLLLCIAPWCCRDDLFCWLINTTYLILLIFQSERLIVILVKTCKGDRAIDCVVHCRVVTISLLLRLLERRLTLVPMSPLVNINWHWMVPSYSVSELAYWNVFNRKWVMN